MASLLRSVLLKPVYKKALIGASTATARRCFGSSGCLLTKKYTKAHEWVSLSGTDKIIATIGITHYAQNSLGQVVYVELPDPGATINSGETVAAVESVKSASDIYTPVGGTVVEANAALKTDPGLINQSAEGEGWICKVEVEGGEGEGSVKDLMGKEEYEAYLKEDGNQGGH